MSESAYFAIPEKRTVSEVWEDAACRDTDPDLWFAPSHYEGKKAFARRVAIAKSICATCPLTAACIADGERHGDKWGIRGGITPAKRGYEKGAL